ncbi:type II secretion system protein [bacterium]|nr:type II secretion system protein [bacterium]
MALGLNLTKDAHLGSREKGSISLKGSQGANFALEDKVALGSKSSKDAYLGLENFGWASKTRHSETPQAGSESVRKCAFTLAEVLITLGIIGVVAALTIPTLVSNNNKRIVETRLAKFYSNINNAIELSEVENGHKENWDVVGVDITMHDWYSKYLEPYLLRAKTEYPDEDKVLIYFNDGSMVLWQGGGILFIPKSSDYQYVPSGAYASIKYFGFLFAPKGQTSNSGGIDKNKFKYHIGKGVEPYLWNWDGTEEKLLNDSIYGCNENASSRAYCTQLIRENGWKIPDDYPFKF